MVVLKCDVFQCFLHSCRAPSIAMMCMQVCAFLRQNQNWVYNELCSVFLKCSGLWCFRYVVVVTFVKILRVFIVSCGNIRSLNSCETLVWYLCKTYRGITKQGTIKTRSIYWDCKSICTGEPFPGSRTTSITAVSWPFYYPKRPHLSFQVCCFV